MTTPPLPSAITALIDQQVAALHQRYPAWEVTRLMTREGAPSGWLARRRSPLTHSQRTIGLLPELARDDAVDLVIALAVQAEIEHPTGRVPPQVERE
ncbi:hypothetical protein [Sphaerisporangium aureirubrum]|uniref:Uncharacterized protein n=1 Tax=Sphaerisporangium aureirubrum TaxID=1544736 RepID=A0ABW1N8Q5_9ACTN